MNYRWSLSFLVAIMLCVSATATAGSSRASRLRPRAPEPLQTTGVDLNIRCVNWQVGSPAQLVGRGFSATRFFDGGVIFNAGDAALTRVQLGCVGMAIFPGESQLRAFRVLIADEMTISVPTKQVSALGPISWYTANLVDYAAQHGLSEIVIDVGVVSATMQGGATYQFDLSLTHGFQSELSNPTLEGYYDALSDSQLDQAMGQAWVLSQSQPPPAGAPSVVLDVSGHCRGTYPSWKCTQSDFFCSELRCRPSGLCNKKRCIPHPIIFST